MRYSVQRYGRNANPKRFKNLRDVARFNGDYKDVFDHKEKGWIVKIGGKFVPQSDEAEDFNLLRRYKRALRDTR